MYCSRLYARAASEKKVTSPEVTDFRHFLSLRDPSLLVERNVLPKSKSRDHRIQKALKLGIGIGN